VRLPDQTFLHPFTPRCRLDSDNTRVEVYRERYSKQMIIINKGNFFTNTQIEKVVKLLGAGYKPKKIVIYETRMDMFRYIFKCFNFSAEEFLGKLEGCYDEASDTVYVCVFAQTDDGDDFHSKQLYSLHAMIHELRHRFQAVRSMYAGSANEEKAEKDADKYATYVVNRKSGRIKEIMGWQEEWQVEEED
jgi:hypothetical protein